MSESAFDINDPNLTIEVPEDYNPEAELKNSKPMPPKDGRHKVRVRLIETKEQPVYFKPGSDGKPGSVLAACKVQIVKEDGTLGAFLKDWYPSTRPRKGQKTTDLAYLCAKLGHPLPATMRHPDQIIEHVTKAFDSAGENGVDVFVTTQWVKSVLQNGVYVETKGQTAITQAAIAHARQFAYEEGLDEKTTEETVQYAIDNPHIYWDTEGNERACRAQVNFLVGA